MTDTRDRLLFAQVDAKLMAPLPAVRAARLDHARVRDMCLGVTGDGKAAAASKRDRVGHQAPRYWRRYPPSDSGRVRARDRTGYHMMEIFGHVTATRR